jgi:hypothetical protein
MTVRYLIRYSAVPKERTNFIAIYCEDGDRLSHRNVGNTYPALQLIYCEGAFALHSSI